jgi:hypothetical protein
MFLVLARFSALQCMQMQASRILATLVCHFVIANFSFEPTTTVFLRTYIRGYSAENVAIEPPELVLHSNISSITVNCPILSLACFSQDLPIPNLGHNPVPRDTAI